MKTPQQPVPKLAKALGIPSLYLKREDLSPYGSHKGRSIPLMMKHYAKQEHRSSFTISSSGNAALAAIHAFHALSTNNPDLTLSLTVFVGANIPPHKHEALLHAAQAHPEIQITQTDRPKQQAFLHAKETHSVLLRQSTDDLACEGYRSLAHELVKIEHLAAIFVPTSSGTTAEGIGKTLLEEKYTPCPELHIAQTPSCAPIAELLGATSVSQEEPSLAGAIVDRVAHRKQAVAEVVQATHGHAWICSNEQIQTAIALTKEHADLTLSPNSALSIAALIDAIAAGKTWNGPVVCLICGA
jgi:threonine dehydratase